MIRRYLGIAILMVSLAFIAIYGFGGFVAWQDAQLVCPGSNQCSDARTTVWMSLFLVAVSLVTTVIALRMLMRA